MKKTLLSLSTLVALSMASCGGSSDGATDPNTMVNADFDTLAGWLPEPQNATLSREKAHSGQYSLKVDGVHEYSLGYRQALGQLRNIRVKKITVSAWAFVPSTDANASLVVAVTNPANPAEKPLLWEGIDLGASKTYGKWTEIKKTIALPDGVLPTSALGLYLWRTGGNKPVYLDDLHVIAEE